jgi:hypothetical protein
VTILVSNAEVSHQATLDTFAEGATDSATKSVHASRLRVIPLTGYRGRL